MARLPFPAPFVLIGLATIAGCGGDDSADEEVRRLEQRLAQAEARAARAEDEAAAARALLQQQAASEPEPDPDEPVDDEVQEAEFVEPAAEIVENGSDIAGEPN